MSEDAVQYWFDAAAERLVTIAEMKDENAKLQRALQDIAAFVAAGSTAGEQAVKNTLKGLGL